MKLFEKKPRKPTKKEQELQYHLSTMENILSTSGRNIHYIKQGFNVPLQVQFLESDIVNLTNSISSIRQILKISRPDEEKSE